MDGGFQQRWLTECLHAGAGSHTFTLSSSNDLTNQAARHVAFSGDCPRHCGDCPLGIVRTASIGQSQLDQYTRDICPPSEEHRPDARKAVGKKSGLVALSKSSSTRKVGLHTHDMNDVRAAVTTAVRDDSIFFDFVGYVANLPQDSIGTKVAFQELFRESSASNRSPYPDLFAGFENGSPAAEVVPVRVIALLLPCSHARQLTRLFRSFRKLTQLHVVAGSVMRQHCVQHSGHGSTIKKKERRHSGRILLSRIISERDVW